VGIYYEMDLVAKESIFLALVSPGGILIGIGPGTATPPLAGTGLFARLVGIGPKMGGIDGSVASQDDLQGYSLGDQLMQDFVEEVFSQTITEIGEGAIGWGTKEIEAAEEAEASIVAEGGGKFTVGADLSQVDKELSLEQGNRIVALCSLV
jgi:hypothetical protein